MKINVHIVRLFDGSTLSIHLTEWGAQRKIRKLSKESGWNLDDYEIDTIKLEL